jgi:DNA-directed RNA polymerase subunit K/omega
VEHSLIYRPPALGAFELAVLAGRRARQLQRGCLPKIGGQHTVAVTALLEVITGTVAKVEEGAIQESTGHELTRAPVAASGVMTVTAKK